MAKEGRVVSSAQGEVMQEGRAVSSAQGEVMQGICQGPGGLHPPPPRGPLIHRRLHPLLRVGP